MKVLDLQCSQQHSFEGWFGSEQDFQNQLSRSLVQCPLCGSPEITKKLSAPRFNLGKSAAPSAEVTTESKNEVMTSSATSSVSTSTELVDQSNQTTSQTQQIAQRPKLTPEVAKVMQATWLEVAKHVMANTEDVGNSFASEARKIHYGEADERAIRGQATPDQTMELLEEGIDVVSMPMPESLKRPLN